MGHGIEPEALLIAGPTASGKSALALELAARHSGMIVNADSMQVYADLQCLTARPSAGDMRLAPHALYGSVDGAEAYSVSRWLADVAAVLERARAQGRLPIVVGGTGLYFKALTQGLSEIPAVPEPVRAAWREWSRGRAAPELHAELARRDPRAAARLRPSDPQRVLRALEVHAATGESLVAFQARRSPPLLDPSACRCATLDVPRPELHARVDRRLDEMFAGDACEEVGALLARRLPADLPVMRALGVPELAEHLAGRCDRATALTRTKASTRAYLKRQATFFRNQLPLFVPTTAEEIRAQFE